MFVYFVLFYFYAIVYGCRFHFFLLEESLFDPLQCYFLLTVCPQDDKQLVKKGSTENYSIETALKSERSKTCLESNKSPLHTILMLFDFNIFYRTNIYRKGKYSIKEHV